MDMRMDTATPLISRAGAGCKAPKAVHFVVAADIPRSETGKVKRHELEKTLTGERELRRC
jgi:acyl-coenzyme A synthetase/AMP-(fatty) acid ligase